MFIKVKNKDIEGLWREVFYSNLFINGNGRGDSDQKGGVFEDMKRGNSINVLVLTHIMPFSCHCAR